MDSDINSMFIKKPETTLYCLSLQLRELDKEMW